jgi:hypothetical protein
MAAAYQHSPVLARVLACLGASYRLYAVMHVEQSTRWHATRLWFPSVLLHKWCAYSWHLSQALCIV